MLARRRFLRMSAASLAAAPLAWPRQSHAQAWPSQPVTIVAPSAAGGSLDILSRLFARGLQDRLGQPFVVENRGGGGGNIGFGQVAKARPDGHTIMIASDPLSVNPSMYTNLPFDPVRDFAPIIMIATLSQVLAINPKVPANTLAEFIALARARPNAMNVGQRVGRHFRIDRQDLRQGGDAVMIGAKSRTGSNGRLLYMLGFTDDGSDAIMMVWPSGRAFASLPEPDIAAAATAVLDHEWLPETVLQAARERRRTLRRPPRGRRW